MSENASAPKPPYVPYGTFKNFIESFREDGLPDVIDRSLMQTLSGTVQSILSAALRHMGFVDQDGVPTDRFRHYISGGVSEQREAILQGLRECYVAVFEHQTAISKMTQGQFDQALKDEYKFTASTLDKAASFFLAACQDIGYEVSGHLQKRKATATRKRREKQEKPDDRRSGKVDDACDPVVQPNTNGAMKPLPYQLLDLLKEPDFAEDHKDAVWRLVQYLMEREKKDTRKE